MAESPYQISAVLSVGENNASFASWTSSTALNTVALIVSNDYSYNTSIVTLNQTTTITGGVVTFEGSIDGVTFFPLQGFAPGTFAPIGPTYALQANTYATFSFNLTGIPYFQVRLSTVISGTGTVTVGYAADSFVNTIGASVTGTVTANQGGTWTVQQGGAPWSVTISGQPVSVSQSGTWNIGTVTAVTSITNALPAGTNVIGHVITDSGSTTVVTGTVAVTQSTSPWVVSLASTTITGTVAVTQSTTPWTIQGDSASGAAKAGNPVQIGGVFNTTQPTVTTGQTVEAQATARGALIVATGVDAFAVNASQTTSPWVVSLASTTITGTVAVTQSTSPWVVNMTQVASTALGTPQSFGTPPSGVVIGTSSDLYVAGTRARSNQTTTAAGVVDVNIVGSLGATNSVTNGTFIAITDNTTKAGVIAATTALKTDQSSQAGTAVTTVPVAFGTGTPSGNAPGVNSALFVGTTPVRSNQTTTATGAVDVNNVGIDGVTIVTAAAGVQKVGIVGNSGSTLDFPAPGPSTSSAAAQLIGGVYSSSASAPTTGQALAMQLDQAGNKLTFPGVQQKTGAAWNSATTINTLQYATGTNTQGQLVSVPATIVTLDQTTTITGGAVTFQGTYDNVNWVTIPVNQIVNPNTFAQLTNPYTFVANTNQAFMILLQGYVSIRLNLTTVITGTGTVTPYWATLSQNPVTTTVVTGTGGTGSIQVSVVPSSNTFFAHGNVTSTATTLQKLESTVYTEQSTGAQRSMSSASANDTSAGTGARTVQITYYDASGNGPNTETVTLNGTTAVNTVNTNICFIEKMVVLTVGSTGSNVGIITLFTTTGGGGTAIGTIAATSNQTFWAHHYVAVGKTFHLTGINIGSTSSTVGAGGQFALFAQTVPVTNQPNQQVSDFLILFGQSSTATRTYNSPIAVPGPARTTLYVTPFSTQSNTYFGAYDFFEQ